MSRGPVGLRNSYFSAEVGGPIIDLHRRAEPIPIFAEMVWKLYCLSVACHPRRFTAHWMAAVSWTQLQPPIRWGRTPKLRKLEKLLV
jgi:hypothetical protein